MARLLLGAMQISPRTPPAGPVMETFPAELNSSTVHPAAAPNPNCGSTHSGHSEPPGDASKVGVYGLNTCATVTYSGSSQFIGTVNAPYAAFTFSGSAGACGSFTAASATISGGAAVHYDEHLSGGGGLFVATSWNEIPAN